MTQSTKPTQVRWLVPSLPKTLIPSRCNNSSCTSVLGLLYGGLTKIQYVRNKLKLAPHFAQSWKFVTSKHVRFQLRQDLKWSDGNPISASHFIESWKSLLKENANAAQFLFPIANARAFASGQVGFSQVGIKARTPHTIDFYLDRVSPQFPRHLSHPATWPFPQETKHSRYSGPYQIASWKPGKSLHLVPNKHHFKSTGQLPRIFISQVNPANLRVQLFLSGEADLVEGLDTVSLPVLNDRESLKHFTSLSLIALNLNAQQAPFHRSDSRRAFQNAMERSELNQLINWPHAPAYRVGPDIMPAPAPWWSPKYDPINALAALGEYLRSKPGKVTLPKPSQPPSILFDPNPLLKEVAQNIQIQWHKNTKIYFPVHSLKSGAKNPVAHLSVIKINPFNSLHSLKSIRQNLHFPWAHRKMDALLQSAAHASHLPNYLKRVEVAEQFLIKDMAILVPLYFISKSVLVSNQMEGLWWNPTGYWNFEEMQWLPNVRQPLAG